MGLVVLEEKGESEEKPSHAPMPKSTGERPQEDSVRGGPLQTRKRALTRNKTPLDPTVAVTAASLVVSSIGFWKSFLKGQPGFSSSGSSNNF